MVKKNQNQKWTERQEEVFKKLKRRFTKKPVLAAPDLNKKIRMGVNVLDYIMKRVLSIEYEDKKWKLVDFLSKSLNETERNYETHNKEMLAVIRGLENQRHLLKGIRFKFEFWTDYKNLEYFIKV